MGIAAFNCACFFAHINLHPSVSWICVATGIKIDDRECEGNGSGNDLDIALAHRANSQTKFAAGVMGSDGRAVTIESHWHGKLANSNLLGVPNRA